MTSRLSIPLFKKLAKLRAKQGFTVIQIVIGIPPETENYDIPLNKTYLNEVEKKLNILWENNLVPCIVGGWGHHIDILGENGVKELWGKILKLTKNKPAVYCLCGEADIFPKRLRLFKSLLLKNRLRKWERIAKFIKECDSQHLLTVHIQSQRSSRKLFGNPDWLDINSIQSGHSKNSIPFMVKSILASKKMMINLEPWYEGILGNFDEYYQRIAFWLCVLSGAKGYSYGAHGIWQMANKDNFMRHWGKSDWRKSIKFQGAEQLGKSAEFLKNYPWWEIMPDFGIINPSWSSDNPYNPVAAAVGNNHIFIYFPNTRLKGKFSITLPKAENFVGISWIDPRTLATIKREKYKSKFFKVKFPKSAETKDILCILSINK